MTKQFCHIGTLSDFLPHVSRKEIRVVADPKYPEMTVACYMIQNESLFIGVDEMWERECRGIVFRGDVLASRPLHKFHNVGELVSTMPEQINWNDVVRIMIKADGSMVVPVSIGVGAFKFKTKKAFSTEEANNADRIAALNPELTQWINTVLGSGYTPIFEMTSPRFPIVVLYEKDELTLLHIRNNATGEYLNTSHQFFQDCPIKVIEDVAEKFKKYGVVSWDLIKAWADTVEQIEGVVIQFSDGDMVKVKSDWYNNLHHAVTFTRYRDVAKAVLDDTFDDLLAAFRISGRETVRIQEVKSVIDQAILTIKEYAQKTAADFHEQGLTVKQVATEQLTDNDYRTQILAEFRGQEYDYVKWYRMNLLDKWSLEVIPTN